MSKIERIDYANGDLEDVAVSDIDLFRMERMADGIVWITLYRSGDKDIVFRLYAVENKIIGELTHAADEWKEPNKQ
jgi:hypothetical protein